MKKLVIVLMLFSLSLLAQAAHQTNLSWTAGVQPTGVTVTGYKVYRSQTSGTYGAALGSTTGATTFVDTAVVAGQTYFYVVTTLCSTCTTTESIKSNQVTITVPADTIPNPPVLSGTQQ